MRVIRCKRCSAPMYDDDDGVLYCPACGWEVGMKLNDDDPILEEVFGE